MRFRNIVCVAGALGLACEQNPAAPAPAGVTHTYDIVAEFSSTLNSDTSVWSYRFQSGQTRDGNYQLVPAFGADTVETWSPSDPGAWRELAAQNGIANPRTLDGRRDLVVPPTNRR